MTVLYVALVVLGVVLVIGGTTACTRRGTGTPRASAPGDRSESWVISKPSEGKVEIIPSRLYGMVSSGDLETTVDGTLSCWHYISDGLRSVGQKEIWVTIKRAPSEAEPPPDPFLLYRRMFQEAEKGSHVDLGYVTLFGEDHPGFFDRPELRGVIFVPLEPSAQGALPFPTIGAVFVTASEAKAALDFGVLRIMGTLGNQHRFFPTAFWNDRARPELPITTSDPPNSMLAEVPHAGYPQLLIEMRSERPEAQQASYQRVEGDQVVRFVNATVVVKVPSALSTRIGNDLSQLDSTTPFALIGDPDPTAVASFAWMPDPPRSGIIGFRGHDARRISAVFAAFVMNESGPTAVRQIEDGFAILLAPKDWEQVRGALVNGSSVTVPATDEHSFAQSVQIVWE